MSTQSPILVSLLLAAPLAVAGPVLAQESTHPTDQGEIALGNFEYFFVGGRYRPVEEPTAPGGEVLGGQMYVEHFTPPEVQHPYPVVMIHGGGQTGTNFIGTPDGRRGWAHDFLRAGYDVYVVDQPGRGRSGLFTDVHGDVSRGDTARVEQLHEARGIEPLAAGGERTGRGSRGRAPFRWIQTSAAACLGTFRGAKQSQGATGCMVSIDRSAHNLEPERQVPSAAGSWS